MKIAAYTYAAQTYCPQCVVDALPTGPGEEYDGWGLADGAAPMSTEDNLNEIAFAFGIDRQDEHTFDSGDFPKVVFSTQIDDFEECGDCGADL